KKFIGVPYLLWVYGGETQKVYMKDKFTTFWADRLLKDAYKIASISRYCQKEFLEYGFPEERVPMILPAVNPDIFTPGEPPAELRDKWKLHGRKVLLTVARIAERKGHDLVLRALPEILKHHPDVIYLIAGKGGDKDRLLKMAEQLGIQDRVLFCGFVPDEELTDYYRLCDIYVMPNREIFDSTDSIEGFGISFIEASACAKPVIGGKSGGAVEAIEDGYSGWLIDPDNPQELAEKVIELLSDDELRRKIGRQGRERVLEKMTWEGRAKEVVNIEV
nr:glycosyltransferase family 4 protein [FCB group bacterium]